MAEQFSNPRETLLDALTGSSGVREALAEHTREQSVRVETEFGGIVESLSAAREENLDERGLPRNLGPQFRAMERSGYDKDAHTVTMALSSDKPVERWYGTEILSHAPGAIRMDRLKQGIPLLFNHDMDRHIGVSVDHEVSGGTLRVTGRFGDNPLATEKEADVRSGILKDVSIGYRVHKWDVVEHKDGSRTMTAVDWEPHEGSLVTVPADAKGSGVGRHLGDECPVAYTFRKLADSADPDEDDDEEDDEDDENDTASESERALPPPPTPTSAPEKRTPTMAVETVDLAAQQKTRSEGLRALHQGNPTYFTADDLARTLFEETPLVEIKERVADKMIAANQRTNVATLGDDVMAQLTTKERRTYSLRNAYAAAYNDLKPGTFKDKESAAGLEREVSAELLKGASERGIGGFSGGIVVPSATTRALASGLQERAIAAGGNAGTASTFTSVDPDPIALLRSKTMCLALGAQVMTGLKGIQKLTRQNAAAASNWLAELAAITNSDPGFDAITMKPNRLSIANSYTLEFLANSAMAIDGILAADRMAVLARSLDAAGLTGSGTNNVPLGLMNQTGIAAILTGTTRAASGAVTQGAGGVPLTFVDINNFEAAVSTLNGDIGKLGWAMSPKVRAALRSTPRLPNGVSDFILPNSAVGTNGVQEGPLGYSMVASSAIPGGYTVNSVPNLQAVIFGVWDQMLFGDWGLSELVVDPYTAAGQALTKITEHGFYDTNIRHIESFAISTSVLPS